MINDHHAVSPDSWELISSPLGYGEWLLGPSAYTVTAVVPPGSPAIDDEPAEEQVRWRLLAWSAGAEGRPWEEASRQTANLAYLVRLLPATQRRWLRASSKRQLDQLDLWSAPAAGHDHDGRAHQAADLRSMVLEDCRAAFPGEGWHASDQPEVPPIPATAAALLQRIDFPDPARAEEVWNRLAVRLERSYFAGVSAYRWLLIRRRRALRLYKLLASRMERPADQARPAQREQDTDQHAVLLP